MNKTWEQENDQLVEDLFKEMFHFVSIAPGAKDDRGFTLELFITGECDQRCEYCYLIKNGHKLYPHALRDHDTILKNMDLLFDYLNQEKLYPSHIDIFTGEIWCSDFGALVLERLLNYIKTLKVPPHQIMIPSNFSFILNEKYLKIIEYYIKAFNFYDVNLAFSCSNDGGIIDRESRPFFNKEQNGLKDTDEYYEMLFEFCKKHQYGFHPMVSAYKIEEWGEQYKWWLDRLKQHDMNLYNYIMFLEVRNNEWTEEKIKSYLEYLNIAVDYTLSEYYNNDINKIMSDIINLPIDEANLYNNRAPLKNYSHFGLGDTNKGMSCSIERAIMIRLGDLAWVPCHRTGYDKFVFGYFKVQDDKIVGMKANNLPLLFSIHGIGYKGHMKCDVCPIGELCPRGCYGAQFEYSKELFFPCPTVCDLYMAKVLFLYYKLEYYMQICDSVPKHFRRQKEFYYHKYISKIPKEECAKWMPTIQHLIKS
jgi:hypothetical protein